jgi:hypothetical protein
LNICRVAVSFQELEEVRVGKYVESTRVSGVDGCSHNNQIVSEHGFSRWIILNFSE